MRFGFGIGIILRFLGWSKTDLEWIFGQLIFKEVGPNLIFIKLSLNFFLIILKIFVER